MLEITIVPVEEEPIVQIIRDLERDIAKSKVMAVNAGRYGEAIMAHALITSTMEKLIMLLQLNQIDREEYDRLWKYCLAAEKRIKSIKAGYRRRNEQNRAIYEMMENKKSPNVGASGGVRKDNKKLSQPYYKAD